MSEHQSAEDRDLDYTQSMRKRVVGSLLKDGDAIPSDPKDKVIMLQALADMDRVSLGKKRISADKDNAASQAAAAAVIAQMLRDPRAAITGRVEGGRDVAPQLPSAVETPQILPGELDIHARPDNYESFQRRTGAEA